MSRIVVLFLVLALLGVVFIAAKTRRSAPSTVSAPTPSITTVSPGQNQTVPLDNGTVTVTNSDDGVSIQVRVESTPDSGTASQRIEVHSRTVNGQTKTDIKTESK